MKSPISTYELVGIFGSVAIMAGALVLITLGADRQPVDPEQNTEKQSAIVVSGGDDGASGNSALANALTDASDGGNTITRLVVNDVRIGTGPAATAGDTVTVNYIGSTRDGVQFDSSYSRGEPFTFTIGEGRVIPGWEQGVPGMKVGGQRILIIPPEMGYGNRAVGPIEPNSILVFAVELLSIK